MLVLAILFLARAVFGLGTLLRDIIHFILLPHSFTLRRARIHKAVLNLLVVSALLRHCGMLTHHALVEEELGACAVDLVPQQIHVSHLLQLRSVSVLHSRRVPTKYWCVRDYCPRS